MTANLESDNRHEEPRRSEIVADLLPYGSTDAFETSANVLMKDRVVGINDFHPP